MSDLIDRQAAIDAVKKESRVDGAYGYMDTKSIVDLLNDLPSAQPERTGRWIHDGYAFKGGVDWMHCSECRHKDSWDVATRTPFCAWCGAKMKGEQK